MPDSPSPSSPSPSAAPRDLYADAGGRTREWWLRGATALRAGLDGSTALDRWDAWAHAHPRGTAAHLRSLLAVHNAEDLVALDLPWWTYRAVDTVAGFLAGRGPEASVFEYGSGASTVWLARRAGAVTSIEHVGQWAERVRLLLAQRDLDHATVVAVPAVPSADPVVGSQSDTAPGLDFTTYVSSIDDHPGPHDLVVVDGRAREHALLRALDHVSDTGMVVLDDAQRARYQEAVDRAGARGWVATRHHGPAPCEPLRRDTITFVRR